MPMKEITDMGPKNEKYLDFIFKSEYDNTLNIEAKTYLLKSFTSTVEMILAGTILNKL